MKKMKEVEAKINKTFELFFDNFLNEKECLDKIIAITFEAKYGITVKKDKEIKK